MENVDKFYYSNVHDIEINSKQIQIYTKNPLAKYSL